MKHFTVHTAEQGWMRWKKMTEFFMWMTYIGLLLVVAGMFGAILFG